MAKTLQIKVFIIVFTVMGDFVTAGEKWNYSADEMDQTKINGKSVRRLKGNVRFVKTNQVILTDNAIQQINEDVLHLNGNTIMINGMDTLICDSMVYWSKLDSGYAMGNVRYIQPDKDRKLTTEIFHYWQTLGYRGSSFITQGHTRVIENDQLIIANEINYDDDRQIMVLRVNASVENPNRGIFGDTIKIHYADSLLEMIAVKDHAFAYNNISVRIREEGPYQKFRDEMTSKEMVAYFKGDQILQLTLMNMATTIYNVIDDSLLVGQNEASGDSININFHDGNIQRIQVFGGALGEFTPENLNTKIDTTIFYGGDLIDYNIEQELTFLSNSAFVEYQDTKLSAGAILVNWDTNILDANILNEQFPSVQTEGESPMWGNSMVFDLIAKHGLIDQGKTSYNQGYYHGKEVYRDDPNIFHVQQSKYTSCELDNPHYYMGSSKMKMLQGDKVIAKPLWLYIYDVPVIGIPLAVFPNKGGQRHSGWIMPSFDSYKSIGTGFRNFGYYWAPNDYMDEKLLINFFDEQGVHISSYFKYKKRNGDRWYNFKYSGNVTGIFKRQITSKEIEDLIADSNAREDQRLKWTHNQQFDPTQRLSIKYEYLSNKDSYHNNQEVSLQNRLKQNLSSSFNYSKNWKTSSFSIGYNQFRDLSIENKLPSLFNYLNEGRYKSYKYEDGPKFNYRIGNRKIFGAGDQWYNNITSSYTMKASTGRKDYWLIKSTENDAWEDHDTTKLKYGGIKHSARVSAPQTFFRWITINPNFSLREDWIFNYKIKDGNEVKKMEGFKRRLLWTSSISAKTKIYGLFPITIGKLNAVRHAMTTSLAYHYQPDFSDKNFGGNIYFQKLESGELFDYFSGSYVGNTSMVEKKTISLSIDNIFQSKIRNNSKGYVKSNFLIWNSSISYNTMKESLNFSELSSNVRVKNLSGNELFRISMYHNVYRLGNNDEPVDELVNLFDGELPRLIRIKISTDLQLNLFGNPIGLIDQPTITDTVENIEDEFYSIDRDNKIKKNSNKLWKSKLQFKYSANWKLNDEEWGYKFSLKTINSINISKGWTLSYIADFNIKEREMTYHSFKFYRPLHCWEFSFNYWPQGSSSGFSLQINVKNPDLQDIKLTSRDGKRGFSGY